jgi:hypothetical protein
MVAERYVSSLRYDRTTGKLAQIEVKGGVNPGGSGDPVFDVHENVVGSLRPRSWGLTSPSPPPAR